MVFQVIEVYEYEKVKKKKISRKRSCGLDRKQGRKKNVRQRRIKGVKNRPSD